MMKTFIIVNITPKMVQRINLSLYTPKRPSFSLQFDHEQKVLGHAFERRAYRFVLKATQGMLMVNINPICKR